MAGFILGTGSGILTSAAVYYTLSTSLSNRTSSLRSELQNSTSLLKSSFSPTTPLPASALIGPPSSLPTPPPNFSELVRSKWNATIASTSESFSRIDWLSLSQSVYYEGKELVQRLTDNGNSLPVSTIGDSTSGGAVLGNQMVGGVPSIPDLRTLSGGNLRDERVDGGLSVVENTKGGRLV